MMIHVVMPENYWPLPWYLRQFNPDRVGYWQDVAAWAKMRRRVPPPAVVDPHGRRAAGGRRRVCAASYNKQMIFGLRPAACLLHGLRPRWTFGRTGGGVALQRPPLAILGPHVPVGARAGSSS